MQQLFLIFLFPFQKSPEILSDPFLIHRRIAENMDTERLFSLFFLIFMKNIGNHFHVKMFSVRIQRGIQVRLLMNLNFYLVHFSVPQSLILNLYDHSDKRVNYCYKACYKAINAINY